MELRSGKRRAIGSSGRSCSSHHNSKNGCIGAWEENTMALLDSSGIKDSRDILEDRLCFLEAVRSASLVSKPPLVPSWRIFNAVFQILTDCSSLELVMASYQLLTDLDKRYPRVYLSKSDDSTVSSSRDISNIVVVHEAWSPFNFTSGGDGGAATDSCTLFDSSRFSELIEDMVQTVGQLNTDLVIKPVGNMLVFQYLVNVLKEDESVRLTLYKETQNWLLLRESILNDLLGSRKLNFKSLVRDCMFILLKHCHHGIPNNSQHLRILEDTCTQLNQDSKVSVAIAVSELEKGTCIAVQNFFKQVLEFDEARKQADSLGLTSRLDNFRPPILDIIFDELTYNKESLPQFLMVFSDPKWKLEIILQYFSKYLRKSSIRTRRSNDAPNDRTLEAILNSFSTAPSAKNIAKKISSKAAQMLLAHAFQACLSLSHGPKHDNSAERIGATLPVICTNLISALKNLRKIDEGLEMTRFAKEALFTATTVLKMKC